MKRIPIKKIRLTSILLIFMMAALLITITGCSKKEEPEEVEVQEEPEEEPLPENINYLTGELLPNGSTEHTRPAAVVVENSYDARPQWGMDDKDNPPDIILEAEVEYGITRLLWFYGDYTKIPAQIGPTRSARPPFIRFSELFDSIFVHWGMSHSHGNYVGAEEVFDTDNVDHINEMGNGSYIFGRDESRDVATEHTGILYGEKLAGAIDDLGFRKEINPDSMTRFLFNEETLVPEGEDCSEVSLRYSGETETTTWTYLDSDKKYTSKDYENSVTRDNLLILLDTTEYVFRDNYYSDGTGITYCDYLLTGGEGKYISMGKSVDITWEVSEGKIILKDKNGDAVKLNPGKTWIGWGSGNNGGEITVK